MISSGGAAGGRLWPVSREFYSKRLFVPIRYEDFVRDDDMARYEDVYNWID